MKNNDQNTNLLNASDEEVARLNKILAKQLKTKMVYTIIGGVTVAVAGALVKHALNKVELNLYSDIMKDLTSTEEEI
jgi:NH3-dependent NAD+ synthetase